MSYNICLKVCLDLDDRHYKWQGGWMGGNGWVNDKVDGWMSG